MNSPLPQQDNLTDDGNSYSFSDTEVEISKGPKITVVDENKLESIEEKKSSKEDKNSTSQSKEQNSKTDDG